MSTYLNGDGATGEVQLETLVGAVRYAAGAGDKIITTGDAATSVNLGSGDSTVHLGAGADTVTFGTGVSTAYAGAGNDGFILHPGALGDTIVGFKGAGLTSGSGPKDFLHLSGFTEGSHLVLEDGAGAAHQTYAVLAADGTVESRFELVMSARPDGSFHEMTSGRDYVLDGLVPVTTTPPPSDGGGDTGGGVTTPPPQVDTGGGVSGGGVTTPPPPTDTGSGDSGGGVTTPPPPTDTGGGTTTTPPPTTGGDDTGGGVTTPPPPADGSGGVTPPAPVATAISLDFDSLALGDHAGVQQGFSISDDGFVIGGGRIPGLGDIGSPGLLVTLGLGHSTTLLERPDGLPFSLDSLDLATAARVVITGHLHDGGDVSQTFAGSGEVALNWGEVDSVSITNVGRAVNIPGANAAQNASLDAASRLVEIDNIKLHLFL